MKIRVNPLLQILSGLCLLAGMAYFLQRGFHSRSRTLLPPPPPAPRLLLIKATIVGWNQGERLWEFSGDELVVDHDNRYLNYSGHGVGKLFYKDKPYVTVLAPKLRFDLISKSAQAFEGVRLYANPSTSLTAQEVLWNQGTGQLVIPGKVLIRSPSGVFKAHHLFLHAYEGRLTMKDVRMAVHMKLSREFRQMLFSTQPPVTH